MIWVTGSEGMLGRELCGLLSETKYRFVATDREVDITDQESIADFLRCHSDIDWIINCAAYTAVDQAEEELYDADLINHIGPINLAKAAFDIGARVVHISTDYVFNGNKRSPYSESDPVDPVGVYGKTKEEGERAVRDTTLNHFIIRTSWLYGGHGKNFVYTMLRLMDSRDEIGVVADQFGSPTWTGDLAAFILYLVNKDSTGFGTYHFSNEGEISWFDFARSIYFIGRELGLLSKDVVINALKTEEYPTKAPRPPYSVLSKEKVKSCGYTVPHWEESLRSFLQSIDRTSFS